MCDIGKKMFDRRKELGLTLEDVGNAVGVGKSTVRKWENGMIKNMGRDKIALVASVLQMSPVEFVPCDDQNDVLNQDEHRLINSYRALNAHGQELLLERSEELKLLHGKKPEDTVSQPG